MKLSPKKDSEYIYRHPYATLVADEYRMGRGYRIVRPSGTDDHLLLLTLAGGGLFRPHGGRSPKHGADRTVPLPPGTILIVRPGTPQDYGTDPAAGAWNFRWLHFHAPATWRPFLEFDETLPGLHLFDPSDGCFPPIEYRRVKALIADAVARTRRGTALDRAFAMNALENALLRLYSVTREAAARDDAFIDAANAFIRDHLSEKLTVACLSEALGGLSPSRFAHKFTAVFGESPLAYLEKSRLEYAKRLLETTDILVKEAAYDAGFADPLYFSRRFRHAYGISPSAVSRR